MRLICAALLAISILAGAARTGELTVTLTVTERAGRMRTVACPAKGKPTVTAVKRPGVARADEPLSVGIPFPKSTLKDEDVSKLAIYDAAGARVPAQFHVTDRWWVYDKSVRWVLASFLVSVPADGKATYTLKTGVEPEAVPNPLKVEVVGSDDPKAIDTFYDGHIKLQKGTPADKVTVTTGPLKFTVKRKGFNLFDEVWIDESGKGNFTDKNRIVASHDKGLVWFTNFKGLPENKRYSAANFQDGSLEVLEAGPVRTVLKLTGKFAAADAENGPKEKLEYEVFIHAWRGSSLVKVTYVYRLREGGLDEGVPIDGMYIELPLSLEGEKRYAFGRTGEPVQGALGKKRAYVLVDGSDHFAFGGAAKEAGGEGPVKKADPQPNELGWADLSDGEKGLTFGLRRFWQQWPKASEVRGDGTVRLHLWANVDEKPREVPADYDIKNEAFCSDTVPGRSTFFPGCSKTHELFFDFHGKPNTARMRAAHHAVETPAWALPDPEWYCEKTWGFGRLASSNPELYAYDPEVAAAVKGFDRGVKENIDFIVGYRNKDYTSQLNGRTYDMFGCYDFGNFINVVFKRGQHRAVDIAWDSNYYDYSVVPFAQFARTGDIELLEHALESDTQCYDLSMMCWHPDRSRWGCGRGCPTQDHIRGGYTGQSTKIYAASVASWHKTNFFRWRLFGDYHAYEASYLAASYPGLNPDRVMRSSGHGARSWGHALKNACLGFLGTGDERLRAGARRLMERKSLGGQSYQKGIAYEGLCWWYEISGDTSALDILKERIHPEGRPGTRFMASGFVYGYTGDRKRLKNPLAGWKNYKGKLMWGSVQDAGLSLRNGVFLSGFLPDPAKIKIWEPVPKMKPSPPKTE